MNKLLTSKLYSILQWISFFIDYFRKIKPALKKEHIVIADRYVYTALTRDAVNGAGRFLGSVLSRLVRTPDLLIFYDTPPEICLQRIEARGKALFHTNKLIYENRILKNKDLYYLKKLRNEYLKLIETEETRENTNIITVNDDMSYGITAVKQYVYQKYFARSS